jgi:acetate kinase
MQDLLDAERRGHAGAGLAVEMFCDRVRKYVGAYLAALGGADAIIFGGGIGEHAPSVRARVCAGMEWCGLTLDEALNEAAVGAEGRISVPASILHACVIPVDEEVIVARDTVSCLSHSPQDLPERDGSGGNP